MAAYQLARGSVPDFELRRLERRDLVQAAQAAAAGFGFDISHPDAARRFEQRLGHLIGTDPEGCFVAERDGRVIGIAEAMRRERLWCLSMLAVDPAAQSAGAGRALVERTLEYADGTDCGLIVASDDSRALRLYAFAGFSLLPTFQATGLIDRRALPREHPAVRESDAGELGALAPISREVRGAPHTAELEYMLERGARLLRLRDRGFAVTQPDHGVSLLVARDEEAATALLWSALEGVGTLDRPAVRWITGAQSWAVDVLLRAGLRLGTYGALAVRGQPGPLRPFIPSPPFA